MRKCIVVLIIYWISFYTCLFAQVQIGADIYGEGQADYFGKSVSISADGSRLAVGAYRNDGNGINSGHVRVFELLGGSWVQLGGDIDGEYPGDESGSAISLSHDGARVAVGANFNDENGRNAGHVRIYELSNGVWTQMGLDIDGEALGDNSGHSVSLSSDGSIVAIGAPLNDSIGLDAGHVRVFQWRSGAWNQIGKDIDGEASRDYFGYTVSLSADGRRFASGALWNSGNGNSAGHVRVFEFIGGSWVQVGNDIDGEAPLDRSGIAISLSSNGKRVAIGSPFNAENGANAGHVRVFEWYRGAWVQMGKDLDGEFAGDHFGEAVSLSHDGERITIGARLFGMARGRVQVFEWNGTSWYQIGADIVGEITGLGSGSAVSMNSDGSSVVIASPLSRSPTSQAGKVRVFYGDALLANGLVGFDQNINCAVDSLEPGVSGIQVEFSKKNVTSFSNSHKNGAYSTWIDTGTFTVSINTQSYPYHTVCPTEHKLIVDSTTFNISDLSFGLSDSVICPYLTVEMNTSRMRRCFPGEYVVSYCNYGSENVINPYIEVKLDSYLDFLGSSIPVAAQTANLLKFQLDSILVGECGAFTVRFNTSCNSILGQQHCSSVHIYPDSLCLSTLPKMSIESHCDGDTLKFEIENQGVSFPHSFPYSISKGLAIVDTGSFNLQKGQPHLVKYLVFDKTIPYQFILAPKDRTFYTATGLVGCSDSVVGMNLPILPDFPQAQLDLDCVQNTGSYDPNDKAANPPGDGPTHNLVPNTPLEYTIRFQNTGTDTAFFINILDTLSTHLDPASFRIGTSSHPYRFEYLPPTPAGNQVLRFIFDPILLPDSGRNQAESNGFIKYNILMKPDLPIGTRIENSAAIYFDYNEPVITNTVFHTIQLPDTNLCLNADINTAITSLSPKLRAEASNATYQWLDCNAGFAPIPGATVQVFTPSINGSYAVAIRQNGCLDTSACFAVTNVSIHEQGFSQALQVYPNPTDGRLFVDLGALHSDVLIRVMNTLGQEVATYAADRMKQASLEIKGSKGIYMVEIQTGSGASAVVKVFKQ